MKELCELKEAADEVIEQAIEREMEEQAKRVVEGLLFSSSEPVPLRKLKEILCTVGPFSGADVKALIDELKEAYAAEKRAFRLEEIAKGYVLRTCEEYHPYIQQLHKDSRPERLSHAALEVLAIIAYRQPITRPQIDEIRGVDSSGIIHTLVDRQLIEAKGKLEVPGRPALYFVTGHFLQHFGLRDCGDLPKLKFGQEKLEREGE